MKKGISIVVWTDGLVRVGRNLTAAQHVEAVAALDHKFLTCCWVEDEEDAPMVAPLGVPPRMIGYCSMGHPEIYSKDVVCPLCAHIAASSEKSAALEQEISNMHAEIEQLRQSR